MKFDKKGRRANSSPLAGHEVLEPIAGITPARAEPPRPPTEAEIRAQAKADALKAAREFGRFKKMTKAEQEGVIRQAYQMFMDTTRDDGQPWTYAQLAMQLRVPAKIIMDVAVAEKWSTDRENLLASIAYGHSAKRLALAREVDTRVIEEGAKMIQKATASYAKIIDEVMAMETEVTKDEAELNKSSKRGPKIDQVSKLSKRVKILSEATAGFLDMATKAKAFGLVLPVRRDEPLAPKDQAEVNRNLPAPVGTDQKMQDLNSLLMSAVGAGVAVGQQIAAQKKEKVVSPS